MPRRFSSSSRSASIPVSAFTNAVLPWSMCPAVPTMMDFIWFAILPEKAAATGPERRLCPGIREKHGKVGPTQPRR